MEERSKLRRQLVVNSAIDEEDPSRGNRLDILRSKIATTQNSFIYTSDEWNSIYKLMTILANAEDLNDMEHNNILQNVCSILGMSNIKFSDKPMEPVDIREYSDIPGCSGALEPITDVSLDEALVADVLVLSDMYDTELSQTVHRLAPDLFKKYNSVVFNSLNNTSDINNYISYFAKILLLDIPILAETRDEILNVTRELNKIVDAVTKKNNEKYQSDEEERGEVEMAVVEKKKSRRGLKTSSLENIISKKRETEKNGGELPREVREEKAKALRDKYLDKAKSSRSDDDDLFKRPKKKDSSEKEGSKRNRDDDDDRSRRKKSRRDRDDDDKPSRDRKKSRRDRDDDDDDDRPSRDRKKSRRDKDDSRSNDRDKRSDRKGRDRKKKSKFNTMDGVDPDKLERIFKKIVKLDTEHDIIDDIDDIIDDIEGNSVEAIALAMLALSELDMPKSLSEDLRKILKLKSGKSKSRRDRDEEDDDDDDRSSRRRKKSRRDEDEDEDDDRSSRRKKSKRNRDDEDDDEDTSSRRKKSRRDRDDDEDDSSERSRRHNKNKDNEGENDMKPVRAIKRIKSLKEELEDIGMWSTAKSIMSKMESGRIKVETIEDFLDDVRDEDSSIYKELKGIEKVKVKGGKSSNSVKKLVTRISEDFDSDLSNRELDTIDEYLDGDTKIEKLVKVLKKSDACDDRSFEKLINKLEDLLEDEDDEDDDDDRSSRRKKSRRDRDRDDDRSSRRRKKSRRDRDDDEDDDDDDRSSRNRRRSRRDRDEDDDDRSSRNRRRSRRDRDDEDEDEDRSSRRRKKSRRDRDRDDDDRSSRRRKKSKRNRDNDYDLSSKDIKKLTRIIEKSDLKNREIKQLINLLEDEEIEDLLEEAKDLDRDIHLDIKKFLRGLARIDSAYLASDVEVTISDLDDVEPNRAYKKIIIDQEELDQFAPVEDDSTEYDIINFVTEKDGSRKNSMFI